MGRAGKAWGKALVLVTGFVALAGSARQLAGAEGDPAARYKLYVIEGRNYCFQENCHIKGSWCCITT